MERAMLWGLLIFGISLLIFSLRKPPLKDWIIMYLSTAYFSIFIGVLVVSNNMLEFPVRFLAKHFDTSILYEYLLFPVVCIYFYQTSYGSRYISIIIQCVLYTSIITIVEIQFEIYTDLIEYHTWTWQYTFISTFVLMLFLRILMQLISRQKKMG
jgi:hypothetical protein